MKTFETPQHRGNQAIAQTIQLLQQLQQGRQTRQQIIDNMWQRLDPESDYDEQENLARQIQQHSKSYRHANKALLEQIQAYLQVVSSTLKSEYPKPS